MSVFEDHQHRLLVRQTFELPDRHCQLKQGWYPPAVSGAAVSVQRSPWHAYTELS
jgi:hypothetical protein